MTLVLQIENYRALDNGSPVRFDVPAQGAKIGRSAGMDWSLPDPTRHISSHHFDIIVQDGVYFLHDVSTNGTYLYKSRERINGYHKLHDGEQVQVGTYVIRVTLQERTQMMSLDQTVFMPQPELSVPPAAPPPMPPAAPPQAPPPTAHAPVAEQPIIPAEPSRPATPVRPEPARQPEPPASPAEAVPPIPSTPASLPPIEDPFAPPAAPDPAPAVPEVPAALDETAAAALPDLQPPIDSQSDEPFIPDDPFSAEPIPEDFDLLDAIEDVPEDTETAPKHNKIFEEVSEQGVQRPPLRDRNDLDTPAGVQAPPSVQIPDFDFSDEDLSTPSIPPAQIADEEVTGQLSLPPREFLGLDASPEPVPGPEPDPVERQTNTPVEPAAGTSGAEEAPLAVTPAPAAGGTPARDPILQAFCRGAGLPKALVETEDPEALAEMLGRSLKITAAEVQSMLEARAATKQSTRIGTRTLPGGSDNNPLKFLPDTTEAMDVMFLRPRAGYKDGPEALDEALGDLRKHQMALFAAIQPALIQMLDGLSPAEIEAQVSGGLMSSGSGKAWERFKKLYAERTNGFDNGLIDVFLKHYAASYSAAIKGEEDDGLS